MSDHLKDSAMTENNTHRDISLYGEQVDLLYQQTKSSCAITLFISVFVAGAHWTTIPAFWVLGWLSAMVVVVLGRC